MKTILIETVENGYLVRPFQPHEFLNVREPLFVYRTVEEIKADLPRLLQYDPLIKATTDHRG